ncbi:MAG: cupin domain-containing protein [Lachnospiraceae bacterium]|nr:cupin domain-containing protein [Lachnospiraceae bacterium]
MHIILLSGGSGKRLWPLSNDIRSKQFIKLFKKSDGTYESMVQRMYRGIKEVVPDADITVAASKTQVSTIKNQLGGDVNVSVEPSRRDTFPAIALACAYVCSVCGVKRDDPIVICPVDPYVDDSYFKALSDLYDAAASNDGNLFLMGIKPTYPSEKYGYIIPDASKKVAENLLPVSEFKEKPDEATAAEYIKKGALWNAGVFAFKLDYVLKIAESIFGSSDYDTLFTSYDKLTKISFDYAVAEKEDNILVMGFSGEWKDLGTWNTFCESMDDELIGEGIIGDACENINIINELDVPILAMGLKDMVIAASSDGIIVSDKHQSSYIKPFVDKIDRPVMYADKSWGSFRIIDVEDDSLTIKVTLYPGHKMKYHAHDRRDEVWSVISGEGVAIVDGMENAVVPGDVITIAAGCKHTIIAKTTLKLIEVQLGKDIDIKDKTVYDE